MTSRKAPTQAASRKAPTPGGQTGPLAGSGGSAREALTPGDQTGPLAGSNGSAEMEARGNEAILVVDDVAPQRSEARNVLSALGYRVQVAQSGREAVTWLRDHDVDLVLLDMVLAPDFDGLDTLKAIQASRPQQRCVMVTGYADRGRIQRALELGAGECVSKPYTHQDLADAVRAELDRP